MERKKLYEASKIKKKPVWIVRFLAAGAMWAMQEGSIQLVFLSLIHPIEEYGMDLRSPFYKSAKTL
jgi:hypothetical protein